MDYRVIEYCAPRLLSGTCRLFTATNERIAVTVEHDLDLDGSIHFGVCVCVCVCVWFETE